MASPVIHLFASPTDSAEGNSAKVISSILTTKYELANVQVRSSVAPIDRLLAASSVEDSPQVAPTLYVVIGAPTPSTTALEAESASPLLNLSTGASNAETTALEIARWASLASPALGQIVRKVIEAARQARLVQDAQWRTESVPYVQAMGRVHDNGQVITGDQVLVHGAAGIRGKVRDRFMGSELSEGSEKKNLIALVTTDRQSGFDRQLALIPYKGAVLNLTSAYWFQQTSHIIKNHLVAVPHPYVSVVRKCQPFPIEFVVRSYMTGSTSTSIWKNYQDGVRTYCGHVLPEGMKKNKKLAANLLTPTTKEEEHDRPISVADIVSEKWMTQADLDVCGAAALRVFALGQELAAKRGLILVDTKYEFGRDLETGEILLIDEVHTPDSSRYWLASTYEEKIAAGKEPDNIDKEFLRLWFREKCDPYKDEVLPEAPRELVVELARRYVLLYEMITWKDFDFANVGGETAIGKAIEAYIE